MVIVWQDATELFVFAQEGHELFLLEATDKKVMFTTTVWTALRHAGVFPSPPEIIGRPISPLTVKEKRELVPEVQAKAK